MARVVDVGGSEVGVLGGRLVSVYASAWLDDFDHVSQWLMVAVCAGVAAYWWVALRATIRLAVPWTVPLTAGLLAVSLWTGLAFGVLALEDDHGLAHDHGLPTALWLRPSVGLYLVMSSLRSLLMRDLVERVLRLAGVARTEIAEGDGDE